jgi:hypothetical protein
VQVGAADPAADYLEPHLAGARIGLGTVDEVELAMHAGDRSHRPNLSLGA